WPAGESVYPGDGDGRSTHAAVRDPDGAVVAVGSVLPEAPPWEPGRADGWRIRGMATEPGRRHHGHGARVLDVLLGRVSDLGGGLVWCNARVGARPFYLRAGFTDDGEVFELPGIGPHTRMWRSVS
ncbi:MAG: GNAT family N-acetyltransferase, partial [Acidimicrobiales bacterium]